MLKTKINHFTFSVFVKIESLRKSGYTINKRFTKLKEKQRVSISIRSDSNKIGSRLINLAHIHTYIYTQYVQLYILHMYIVIRGISAFRTNSFLRFFNFLWQRNTVLFVSFILSQIDFLIQDLISAETLPCQMYKSNDISREKRILSVCWKSSLWFNSSDERFKFQINSVEKKLYKNLF